MSRVGWWANHDYVRRSVEKDVTRFVGWTRLHELIAEVPQYNFKRNQALFVTTFLTGGRIEEVLQLRKSNFKVNKDTQEIIVNDMRLLKRYEKLGEYLEWVDEKPTNKLSRLFKFDQDKNKFFRNRYETESKEEIRREFRFATTEDMAEILLNWLEMAQDYLFVGYRDDHLGYDMAYKIITTTGVYPHWLRAQRASCLISEYGWKMEMMMEWMGWEELTTARHYAKYGPAELVAGKSLREISSNGL